MNFAAARFIIIARHDYILLVDAAYRRHEPAELHRVVFELVVLLLALSVVSRPILDQRRRYLAVERVRVDCAALFREPE